MSLGLKNEANPLWQVVENSFGLGDKTRNYVNVSWCCEGSHHQRGPWTTGVDGAEGSQPPAPAPSGAAPAWNGSTETPCSPAHWVQASCLFRSRGRGRVGAGPTAHQKPATTHAPPPGGGKQRGKKNMRLFYTGEKNRGHIWPAIHSTPQKNPI